MQFASFCGGLAICAAQADYFTTPANKPNNEGNTMIDAIDNKPSTSFWAISGAALIWNLFGFTVYLNQVTTSPDELKDAYTDAQVAFIQSTPVWATSAFAIAVTAGVLACLMLLLRRAWAVPLFIVSFVAVLVQSFHDFVLNDAVEIFGSPPAYIQGTIIAVGIAMIWYSRHARDKRWLT
jgi:hypothetical protein